MLFGLLVFVLSVLGWDELQRHRGAVKIPASSCRDFNLGQLGSMLDHMPMTPGVTTPYLYVSMKATSAPWHVEVSSFATASHLLPVASRMGVCSVSSICTLVMRIR